MTRFVSVCAAIGLLVGAGVAQAQATETGMLPNSAQITFDRLFINEDGGEAREASDPDALRRYLNRAHCTCGKEGAGDEQFLNYQLRLTTDTGTDRPGDVFVGGPSCDDDLLRDTQCRGINTIGDIDQMALRPENLQFTLYEAINVNRLTEPCIETEGDASIWVLVDSDANGAYDYTVKQVIGESESGMVKGPDTQPPPLPTEIEASSAESSVVLSWTAPISRASDLAYYQVLCSVGDAPAFDGPTYEARYQTSLELCGVTDDDLPTETVITSGDEGSMVTLATL
ncbi:MAG: hypothetical protein SFX73_18190, partial [Kofleriaceae bacterium]|nr:hypothetical protein [Kofleriaceae bacterium]